MGELRERLLQRGYRSRVVNSAFEKVRQLDRSSALEKVAREQKEDRVKAIFKYDRRLPDISSIMRRNWDVMVNDDRRLKKVFEKPPMVCFSRTRNKSCASHSTSVAFLV